MGVFGSVARDEQNGQSDIDLLVEFSKPVGFVTSMRLENFLSERLGKQVDLVTPDFLKPVIRQDVLSEVIYVSMIGKLGLTDIWPGMVHLAIA